MILRRWTKSSYSKGGMDNCVECRTEGERIHLRDSQNRSLGHLSIPAIEWRAPVIAVRRNELR